MKEWIQRFLGTYHLNLRLNNLAADNIALYSELKEIRRELRILSLACGRVIAKIDPMFITPEDDPARKAASDAAGQAVIDKFSGEDHYSNRTL